MRQFVSKNRRSPLSRNFFLTAFFLISFAFAAPLAAEAQEDMPDDLAPPPLKIISPAEKKQLAAVENDVRKHTQLAFDLMEAHLAGAETKNDQNYFADALGSLAAFQAILENSLDFLTTQDSKDGKVQKSFKMMEITLRKQTPRIEIIRRAMPYKYGYYLQGVLKYVREAREKAVEPLFSDTVVPDNKP